MTAAMERLRAALVAVDVLDVADYLPRDWEDAVVAAREVLAEYDAKQNITVCSTEDATMAAYGFARSISVNPPAVSTVKWPDGVPKSCMCRVGHLDPSCALHGPIMRHGGKVKGTLDP